MKHVLLIDDSESFTNLLQRYARLRAYDFRFEALLPRTPAEMHAILRKRAYFCCVLDKQLGDAVTSHEVLQWLRKSSPAIPIIGISSFRESELPAEYLAELEAFVDKGCVNKILDKINSFLV